MVMGSESVEAAIVVNNVLANQFASAVDVPTRFDEPGENLKCSNYICNLQTLIHIFSIKTAEQGEFKQLDGFKVKCWPSDK